MMTYRLAGLLRRRMTVLALVAIAYPAGMPAQCAAEGWSAPRSFFPPLTAARFGSVVVTRERIMIAGNRLGRFDNTTVGDSSLAILSSDTTTVGRPAGSFLFLSPRIAADKSGRLYLFWAEPDSAGPLNRRDVPMAMLRLRSLWYAVYTSQTGWTSARLLYTASHRLDWRVEAFADPVVSANGTVQLVVPGFSETLYIRAANGEATAWPIAGFHSTMYAALQLSGHARLAVAYIAGNFRDGRDETAIYLTTSADNGRHWSPSRIIFSSELRRPNQVKLLADPTGDTLYAVWTMLDQARFSVSGAAIATSSDGGDRWSSPAIAATQAVIRFEAARDGCGTVHVVFDHWGRGAMHGHLDYMCWHGGWAAPVHLSPTVDALDPKLSTAPDGRTVLTYLGQRPDAPISEQWSTLWRQLPTVRDAGCSRNDERCLR